ncbi:MAG: hypothetical protein Q9227_002570 [Pyrenula ochraceoflavens]
MHFIASVANVVALLSIVPSSANLLPDASQIVIQSPGNNTLVSESVSLNIPKIAIIGAGISGASLAHQLHQKTRLQQPLDISVFESEDQVGGRIRSAPIHDIPLMDVECGAMAFFEDDWCIREAMQDLGLKKIHSRRHSNPGGRTGVWDGSNLLVSYDNSDNPLAKQWWKSPKWLWRYGTSLSNVQKMVAHKAKSFSMFAVGPHLSILEELRNLFSPQDVLSSAFSFFENERVNTRLVNEIIRAASRDQYARDLSDTNVLSSVLALRTNPSLSVFGGNQRLPHRMLKISEAHVHLNTPVSRITTGEKRLWKIHFAPESQGKLHCQALEDEFDIVVLTAPFAHNHIDIDPFLPTQILTAEVRPYVERHVTLFSTLHRLSSEYFNQPANTTLPEDIFITPQRPVPEGTNDIFSITIAKHVPPEGTGDYIKELENVYKIISSQPVPDDEIARLLGHHIKSPSTNDQPSKSLKDIGVTWIHRQAWPNAYPQYHSANQTFDKIRIGPDLYYTSAGEEALSTMEMGCRIGYDLANHLYYSKWSPKDQVP